MFCAQHGRVMGARHISNYDFGAIWYINCDLLAAKDGALMSFFSTSLKRLRIISSSVSSDSRPCVRARTRTRTHTRCPHAVSMRQHWLEWRTKRLPPLHPQQPQEVQHHIGGLGKRAAACARQEGKRVVKKSRQRLSQGGNWLV